MIAFDRHACGRDDQRKMAPYGERKRRDFLLFRNKYLQPTIDTIGV